MDSTPKSRSIFSNGVTGMTALLAAGTMLSTHVGDPAPIETFRNLLYLTLAGGAASTFITYFMQKAGGKQETFLTLGEVMPPLVLTPAASVILPKALESMGHSSFSAHALAAGLSVLGAAGYSYMVNRSHRLG